MYLPPKEVRRIDTFIQYGLVAGMEAFNDSGLEVNEQNGAEKLGFKDFQNSVFINEKNYKKKFDDFLETSDDPKWEKIANAGREYTLSKYTNDHAVNSLVDLIETLIK